MAEQSAILGRVLADVAKLTFQASGLSLIKDAERQSWAGLVNLLAEAQRARRRALNEATAEVVADLVRARKAWEKVYKYPYPASIEDWQRLATLAGLNPNFVLQGQWKPADVLPIIEGYLQRRAKPAKPYTHKPWPGSRDWHNWGIGRDAEGNWHLFHFRRSETVCRWIHHPRAHVPLRGGAIDALAQDFLKHGSVVYQPKIKIAVSRLRSVICKAVADEGHRPQGDPIPYHSARRCYAPVVQFGIATRQNGRVCGFSPRA